MFVCGAPSSLSRAAEAVLADPGVGAASSGLRRPGGRDARIAFGRGSPQCPRTSAARRRERTPHSA